MSNDSVGNAVKALGEVFVVPGASQLLDGDFKSGTLHALGGIAAKALLGPVGWLAVGANSFSDSVTGKPIYRQFSSKKDPAVAAAEEAQRRAANQEFEAAVAAAAKALEENKS